MANADYNRAINLAHRLSSELRQGQERAREFEAEARYFRDRAAHAEEWLARIHTEVERTFFPPAQQKQRAIRGRRNEIRFSRWPNVSGEENSGHRLDGVYWLGFCRRLECRALVKQ